MLFVCLKSVVAMVSSQVTDQKLSHFLLPDTYTCKAFSSSNVRRTILIVYTSVIKDQQCVNTVINSIMHCRLVGVLDQLCTP